MRESKNSEKKQELIEALQALAQVQRNGTTLVNNEIHKVIAELMTELKL